MMADTPAPGDIQNYRAFISYSHADDRFATWLHKQLESWRLPDGSRLAPIFIDRAELPAGPDLSVQVRNALVRSDALVVIASPNAKGSRWVGQEIELFREVGPEKPVFTALIDGEPDEAFPLALTQYKGESIEPLAADFRKNRDGRRLALLKIAAGLSGLPLDRLVQRDAQARQRRVMAITAAAAILIVVLSTMLVFALRARAEAERQRAEAEGMVEFMLTDLRDRLKGVGRLDIMDAVNDRAMAHYKGEQDLGGLPPDIVLRRAKLLQAMGADELERAGYDPAAGQVRARAAALQREAWRETKHLLDQKPDDPARIFAHAQSEFYLGSNYLADPTLERKTRARSALPHFLTYRALARKLIENDRNNLTWMDEVGYAEGNVCQVGLDIGEALTEAAQACRNATTAKETVWRGRAGDLDATNNLANTLAWEADARLAIGDAEGAIALRRRQLDLVQQVARLHPKDARALTFNMLARLGMAGLLAKLKRWDEAEQHANAAAVLTAKMRQTDPANGDWKDREVQITRMLGAIKRREIDDGRHR